MKKITNSEKERLYQKGDRFIQAKNYKRARECYEAILKTYPTDHVALHDLALIDIQEANYSAAEARLKTLVTLYPKFVLASITLANLYWHWSDREAAILLLENKLREIEVSGERLLILKALSGKYTEEGKIEKALSLLQEAQTYARRDIQVMNSLAVCYNRLSQFEKSIIQYRESLSINSEQPGIHIELFKIFLKTRDFSSAKDALKKYHKYAPGDAFFYHFNTGKVFSEEYRFKDAIDHFEKALKIVPDSTNAIVELMRTRDAIFRFEENRKVTGNLINFYKENPENTTSGILFILATAEGVSKEGLFEVHKRFGSLLPSTKQDRSTLLKKCSDILKVGFISGDFCYHPVSQFFLPLLRALKKQDVELYGYSNTNRPDKITDEFKESFSNWWNITGKNDASVAEMIRRDDLDILVDLSGHTTDNRLGVIAHHPARVTCTYLGYLTTTGLESMDYWILDETVFPEFLEEQLTETPYRLKRPWISYPLPAKRPEIQPIRKSLLDPVVFGTANNVIKYSQQSISLFSKVLNAVPNSKFLLKHNNFGNADCVQGAIDTFSEHGIPSNRLIFKGFDPSFEDHIRNLQQIDIALDTTPFNGGTTTCDTLYAGVPVLTLAGNRFISRMSATILHSLDLDEWICATEEEFVAKAFAFSMDIEGRNQFRTTIQQRMAESKLCDVDDLAKCMVEAFYDMLTKAGY